MAIKGLISQARQIKSSKLFGDVELGTDNAARQTTAEGQAFLEDDMNIIRSLVKDITGEATWSDVPAVTLAESASTINKNIIQPVQFSGTVLSGQSTMTSVLPAVAGVADTTSTTDLGYVVSAVALPLEGDKGHVSVRDAASNMPLLDAQERKVFGVARNVLDAVAIDFFVRDTTTGDAIAYSFPADTNFEAVLPNRTKFSEAAEQFPMINAGWADAVSAFEIGNREYVDGLLNDGTTATFGFVANEDLTATINKIALKTAADINLGDNIGVVSGITSATFDTTFGTDGAHYLADSDTLLAAIVKLDAQAKVNEIAALNASPNKYVTVLGTDIAEGTFVTTPATYLNTDVNAMTIFVNGQQLVSDNVVGGATLGDYTEPAIDSVTFNFPLEAGDVITYSISKAGN